MYEAPEPLRILAVAATWHGANDYAFVRAFRRAGHSVTVVPVEQFVPKGWSTAPLKVVRKLLLPALIAEYSRALVRAGRALAPDLFFVFKGEYVNGDTIEQLRAQGAVAINFYPDTGFADHGSCLPRALRRYDWVFTTKSIGVQDLAENYAMSRASFVPHAFDPETHRAWPMSASDHLMYDCDVAFVGNWSKKKGAVMAEVCRHIPERDIRIWGAARWRNETGNTARFFQGRVAMGSEYAKAILGARINLGLLFEGGASAPRGDLITARTFEIPATGGFMLHERNAEVEQYFRDGVDCAFFDNVDDLIDKIRYYLDHEDERAAIAQSGHERVLHSGFSVDDRVRLVLQKYRDIRATQS